MAEGTREAGEADDELVSVSKARAREASPRVAACARQETMENEFREAVRLAHENCSSRDCRRCPRTIPREAMSDTLAVSRSNLIDQSSSRDAKRGHYCKADDDRLMPMIRALVDRRLMYGCLI